MTNPSLFDAKCRRGSAHVNVPFTLVASHDTSSVSSNCMVQICTCVVSLGCVIADHCPRRQSHVARQLTRAVVISRNGLITVLAPGRIANPTRMQQVCQIHLLTAEGRISLTYGAIPGCIVSDSSYLQLSLILAIEKSGYGITISL